MANIEITDLVAAGELNEEQLESNFIKYLKDNPNNLSFWFPKVKDCGIRVPKTVIVPVPENIHTAFFGEDGEKGEQLIRSFVEKDIMSTIENLPTLPFIKNGCFSNKFNFSLCCPEDKDIDTIIHSIKNIEYDSLCFDTAGSLEIVLRERIPSPENLPRIYGGMPLNCEFRVFYDFDEHKALYVMNYWDHDYCRDAIADRNPSDGEAFDKRWPSLDREYHLNAETVLKGVSAAMEKVSGLKGIWSIDILRDAEGRLWLIDMAVGRQSAYWDPYKAALCRLYEKMDAFIIAAEYETPADIKGRRYDFNEYRLYNDYAYKASIEAAFIYAYVKPKIGTELKGDDAEYFGVWDFIDRELPKNERNDALVAEAEKAHKEGFESPSADKEYKERWQKKWEKLTDILFVEAASAFLDEKEETK